MDLWPWQEDALAALAKTDYNGVLKVASGKGKTVLALAVIEKILSEHQGSKALVVVPTINLMHQWAEEINKFIPQRTHSFYFGEEKNESGDVVIAVINSATSHSFVSTFRMKVLDEIHHYGAELYQGIFSVPTMHTIGLSATPERDDEGDLAIRYGAGKIVFELENLAELQERFTLFTVRVPLTISEYQRYVDLRGQYKKLLVIGNLQSRSVERAAKRGSKYALAILKIWSQMTHIRHVATNKLPCIKAIMQDEQDKKIIIFSESIEFSEKVGSETGAIVVHSKLSKKEVLKRLEQFRALEKGVLVAPRLIDEGYDVPDANVAIIASFSRSSRQMIQRDGRLLRKKDFVRRYTLVLDLIEEEKYFTILRKTNTADIAKEGAWLRFEGQFLEDVACKEQFNEFLEDDEHYEAWVMQRLDYYHNTQQMSADFYDRHKPTILRLVQDNPARYPSLQEKRTNKKVRIANDFSEAKERELKEQLRSITARVLMPDEIFTTLMRCIEGEPFELDHDVNTYIQTIAESKHHIWPEELHRFLKLIAKEIKKF
ncbi:MAG: DEAD/DEAH box helicase [Candidatus Woesearchaeota archaeon]|nr:MAG: DEAD/DEAH box helicase [Candidatus Woesearchaeota archaeon]